MVFSLVKAWLTRMVTRRRMLDELANLSSDQLRDTGLDCSGLVLPHPGEPDGVMLQRVGWRAERPEVQARRQDCELRISEPATPHSHAGNETQFRFSCEAVWATI